MSFCVYNFYNDDNMPHNHSAGDSNDDLTALLENGTRAKTKRASCQESSVHV
jgi:hypothetical protein